MGSFIVFILKSSIGLIIFYLGYRWLLRNTTFYRVNRLILLSILFLIPVFSLQKEKSFSLPVEMGTDIIYTEYVVSALPLSYQPVPEQEVLSPPTPRFPYVAFLVFIYLLGVILMSIHFLGTHIYLLMLIRRSKRIKREDGTVLVIHNKKLGPFSWMNYILISEQEDQKELDCILTHEKAHIDHLHTLDLFLAQLVTIIFWFNPAAWLLKKEIQKINEYEADASVLSSGTDAKAYQLLLIKKAVGTQRFNSMTNSFNHSKLKIRITMMLKEKTPSRACIRYLYVLPALALMLAIFERPALAEQIDKFSEVEVNELFSFLEMKLAESKEIKIDEEDKFSNLPLIVVNEKPVNVDLSDFDFATADEEDFAKLIGTKAADILSIEVLKDAAATAKYGARARHGVLCIVTDTTKNVPSTFPKIKGVNYSFPLIGWNRRICKVEIPSNFNFTNPDINEVAKLLKIKASDIQNIELITDAKKVGELYGIQSEKGVLHVQTDPSIKSDIERIPYPPVIGHRITREKTEGQPLVVWNGGICEVNLPENFSNYRNADKETLAKVLKIKPEDIESIKFIESEEATRIYGKKAKDGVIYVQVDKNVKPQIKRVAPPPPPIPSSSAVLLKDGEKEILTTLDKITFGTKFNNIKTYQIDENELLELLELLEIKNEDVESIRVLKDSATIAQYGEEGILSIIVNKENKLRDTIVYYLSVGKGNIVDGPIEVTAKPIQMKRPFAHSDAVKNPLVIVDGKPLQERDFSDFDYKKASEKEWADFLKIKSKDIESISVLNDDENTKAYGIQGEKGIIIIKTNSKKKEVGLLPSYFVADSENPEGVVEISNGKVVKTEKKEIIVTPTVVKDNPLIVIDGKIFEGKVPSNFNYSTANEKDWANYININELLIKSISVLKDPTALALYGEEAENGVILIETNAKEASQVVEKKITLKPLVTIDGVPHEIDIPADFDLTKCEAKELGKLVNIKPYQLESASLILNDKTAVSLYGKRAENGIISVITTKNERKNGEPLFVVNGIPQQVTLPRKFNFKTAKLEDFGNLLNLNPADIFAIEVIKGKTIMAFYGRSAQNGVLSVTTINNTYANLNQM